MGIDHEEKAFYDILFSVSKKYEFEYEEEKMIELSKEIKKIVDDKSKYAEFSTREDIKAELQVDLIMLLDEYVYLPVTIDDVYKEVLEQTENFKKYQRWSKITTKYKKSIDKRKKMHIINKCYDKGVTNELRGIFFCFYTEISFWRMGNFLGIVNN